MLDIKFLRENPDIVKQNIKNKWNNTRQKPIRATLAKNSIRAQSSKQIKQRNIPSTTNARKL